MVTDCVHQPDPQGRIAVELAVGQRKLLEKSKVCSVSFGCPVESDQENMTASFQQNPGLSARGVVA
jgi:hypothetical protein